MKYFASFTFVSKLSWVFVAVLLYFGKDLDSEYC